MDPTAPEAPAPGFVEVLRHREFGALFVAQLLSVVGDQVARVALAVLVYQRTSSATLATTSYAVTYLPWLVGGPALTSLGDRLPRRTVLVCSDLIRAAVVATMVIPGLPVAVLLILIGTTSFVAPAFDSARAALLGDVLAGPSYVVGSALSNMTLQGGQVAGFAVGGAIAAAITPRGALALDAGTFLASAALVVARVRPRPAAAVEPADRGRATDGLRLVARDRTLRALVLLAWIASFFSIAAEGLAVAVVGEMRGSSTAVGLLTAAEPLGALVGAVLLVRLVAPEKRLRLLLPLGLLSVAPLVPSVFVPHLGGLFALWVVAGLGGSYNLAAAAAFVQAVPVALRSRAFGVAQGGLQIVQGVGLVLAGVAADQISPRTVVTWAGVAGFVGIALLAARWPETLKRPPSTPAERTAART